MATVDVQTGNIIPSAASLPKGASFNWTCIEAPNTATITVTAALVNGQPWFTPSPTPAFAGGAGNVSVPVTAFQESANNCTWLATGVNVEQGAHVKVGSSMEHKKAS
jgi:hypothetical protein